MEMAACSFTRGSGPRRFGSCGSADPPDSPRSRPRRSRPDYFGAGQNMKLVSRAMMTKSVSAGE